MKIRNLTTATKIEILNMYVEKGYKLSDNDDNFIWSITLSSKEFPVTRKQEYWIDGIINKHFDKFYNELSKEEEAYIYDINSKRTLKNISEADIDAFEKRVMEITGTNKL